MPYLQASIALQLSNSFLTKYMPTRYKVDRLHIRTQLLGCDRANPSFMATVLVLRRPITLSVNFKFQFHHVPQSLDSPAEDLFAVGLRADPFHFVAGEEKLEDGIFVIKISRRI